MQGAPFIEMGRRATLSPGTMLRIKKHDRHWDQFFIAAAPGWGNELFPLVRQGRIELNRFNKHMQYVPIHRLDNALIVARHNNGVLLTVLTGSSIVEIDGMLITRRSDVDFTHLLP